MNKMYQDCLNVIMYTREPCVQGMNHGPDHLEFKIFSTLHTECTVGRERERERERERYTISRYKTLPNPSVRPLLRTMHN